MNNYTTSSKNSNSQTKDHNTVLLQRVEPTAFIPGKPSKKERIKRALEVTKDTVFSYVHLIFKLTIIGAFIIGLGYVLNLILTPAVMTVLGFIFVFILLAMVRFYIKIILSLLAYILIIVAIIALIWKILKYIFS